MTERKSRDHLFYEKLATFEEGTCVECSSPLPEKPGKYLSEYVCSRACNDKLHGLLWIHIQSRILRENNWECADCGQRAHRVYRIVPLFAGGGSEDANLLPACETCHSFHVAARRARGRAKRKALKREQATLDVALGKREESK
jgi:5-methylcytosine-specific restriction endonuclease McrA